MGWTHCYAWRTAAQAKAGILQEIEASRVLAHGGSGNEFYVALRGREGRPDFIALFLLSQSDGCWGYKDMDESMGPIYYNVPKKVLKAVPNPPCESAARWRAAVAKVAEDKAAKKAIRPGQRVELFGTEYTYRGPLPTRPNQWMVETDSGKAFRIPPQPPAPRHAAVTVNQTTQRLTDAAKKWEHGSRLWTTDRPGSPANLDESRKQAERAATFRVMASEVDEWASRS